MLDGLDIKPPGIVWLGQFFVGIHNFLGSVESSLLLSILITQFVLLYVIVKIGRAMCPGQGWVAAIGALFAAGTQLFVGLSHQFFVEPLQAVAVAWAFYLAEKSPEWPKPRTIIHLAAVLILGALSKATTPMYCFFPLGYAAVQVLRHPPAIRDFASEMKVRSSLAIILVFGVLGVLGGEWYFRHLADVWRHVHDSSTGDVALHYGYRDTIFNKLVIWSKLLRDSFLAPWLSWAFLAALLLGPVRAMLPKSPLAGKRYPQVAPIAWLSILQVVLLLFTFSSAITVDSRYMYALLPPLATIFMQFCAMVPRNGLMVLVLLCLVQWVSVNATAEFQEIRFRDQSEWLKPLQRDGTRYEEVARAAHFVSQGAEHNDVVAVEEPWLNANSLAFFASKDRLVTGVPTYFVSLGYAQTDPVAAFRRIDEYHARYVITLAEPTQNASPDFLNQTALPVLMRIRHDNRFVQMPFASRSGLVIFQVNPGLVDTGLPPGIPDNSAVPAAIARFHVVERGKAALDSLDGSLRASDGSFTIAADGVVSCDGWAFDDVRKSTPVDVWIELTEAATGHRYYWHAQRYARPALADAVKIASIRNAGFHCDAVGYRLPAGLYTAEVYQVDVENSIVNNFSTYTASPRITVR